jgi:hypothetical protein
MLVARRGRKRTALSVIEMMIAVSVFAAVGIFVSFLTIEIARMSRNSLDLIPSELNAYRTVDHIRRELLSGTTRGLTIDTGGDGITFTNPARNTQMDSPPDPIPPVQVRIWLDGDGQCFMNTDANNSKSEPVVIGEDIEDLRFERVGDRRVRITIQTFAIASTVTTERERTTTYSDVITLRN